MNSLLKSSSYRRVVTSLVACVSLAAGCEHLLADIQVEAVPLERVESINGSDAGVMANPGEGETSFDIQCVLGEVRCAGEELQVCFLYVLESSARWVPQENCQSAELCADSPVAHCVQRECDAGEVDCQGAIPRICNAAQTGWDSLGECSSAAHCSTSDSACSQGAPCCQAVACEAGDLRCSSGELQRCNADRTDWDLEQSCQSADLCKGGLANCSEPDAICGCRAAECSVGETRCTGATMEICNAGLSGWDVVAQCATEQLCGLGLSLSPSSCQPPACELDELSCSEVGVLQRCRADRTNFESQADCGGPQFCNLVSGQCDEIPCQPGEQRCNGTQIQTCRIDQLGFDDLGAPCATAALCNANDVTNLRCDPPLCEVNQFECFNGPQLSRCNDGRTGFQTVGGACPRADLCSGDRRRCDFCVLGRRECNIAQNASRTCSASGDFFGPETPCPLGCIPDTGACRTCQVGSFNCQGNNVARCNDGFSFQSTNQNAICDGARQLRCNNGQLLNTNCGANGCNQFASACNECSGQQRRCSGAGFEQCNGGFFDGVQACGTGLSCGGQGQCTCEPLELRCSGATLLQCEDDGGGFEQGLACDGAELRTCTLGVLDVQECASEDSCNDAVGAVCL